MSNALDINNVTENEMVQEFQCSGCVSGPFEDCYQRVQEDASASSFRCGKHCLGTTILGRGRIALGLPKGFNKEGFEYIRLHTSMPTDLWNHLNIPVWVLERDGYLFVKTFAPRINKVWVDVIKGGKIDDMPALKSSTGRAVFGANVPLAAIYDVGEFIEEID